MVLKIKLEERNPVLKHFKVEQHSTFFSNDVIRDQNIEASWRRLGPNDTSGQLKQLATSHFT